MTLYTRHQLLLVLLIAGAAGAGLAIDHWRRASPDLVERLERADRAERPAPEPAAREPRRAARSSREPRERATPQRVKREMRHGREGPARERDTQQAPTPETPLDVNRASVPELTRLPGVGPTLARRIVEARPFEALDDLAGVRGLRPNVLARLRPLLAVTP